MNKKKIKGSNSKLEDSKEFLLECCQSIIKQFHTQDEEGIIQANYACEKCGKYIKIYPNKEKADEMNKKEREETLVEFWRNELEKRGYHVIKDTEYSHHGEIILRALQDDLSSLEMKILGEVKGDRTIIYLQPESCCDLADEYEREPIKLPLIQLPSNAKGIKYFDYFPFSWKYPIWGSRKGEQNEAILKDIWEDRNKSSHLGTYFPKAKKELAEKLVNKGFKWEGGEEGDDFLRAICPRCEWTYNYKLTEKYMKVKEQKEMCDIIKKHKC